MASVVTGIAPVHHLVGFKDRNSRYSWVSASGGVPPPVWSCDLVEGRSAGGENALARRQPLDLYHHFSRFVLCCLATDQEPRAVVWLRTITRMPKDDSRVAQMPSSVTPTLRTRHKLAESARFLSKQKNLSNDFYS
jgi:hypothetical protein